MKFKITLFILFCIAGYYQPAPCEQNSATTTTISAPTKQPLTLDDIVNKIEKRYAASGFSANFKQSSTLKAMEITDTADGKVFIKRPGMMRWEYEVPDKQIIITDGYTLWMYRPEDNQVMTGNAPAYFGDGKGASFLSDLRVLRQNFNVTLEKKDAPGHHILKLLPKKKKYDLSAVYLSISKDTFDIAEIISYNLYEDKTLIELSDFQFNKNLDDAMFSFTIPEGTDIIELEDTKDPSQEGTKKPDN